MKASIKIRSFLIFSLIGVLGFSCVEKNPREVLSLDGSWLFAADSTGEGIKHDWPRKGIDKNIGIIVEVPHAWNTMVPLTKYWGKAWYEKEIYIPADWKKNSVKIQFDAVYHDARIWINGKLAGQHIGSGYNRFYISADSMLQPGRINRIIVLADNSASVNNLPVLRSYDWANDGGITRSVCLVKTEKESIEDIHVFAIPSGLKKEDGYAVINVKLNPEAINSTDKVLECTISEINQETSKVIWKGNLEGKVEGREVKINLNLKGIKPWHFDKPNLYKLRLLFKIKGKVQDNCETIFGFRNIAISSTHFILNGEKLKIGGVEWMPGSNLKYGMAEPRSEMQKNLLLIKKVNAIYTRFHWEQDEYILDWCDRNGIMVQEELPAWGWGPRWNDSLFIIAKNQLKEIIISHFNHPSIISWGIGNELNSHDSVTLRYLKGLYDYCRNLDSSRLVNYVSNQLNIPRKGKVKLLPDASNLGDILMFNEYYSTWYNQKTDSISGALDRIHADYPSKALVISEFGICEPVFKGGDTRRIKEMKEQFRIYGTKSYVAGAIYFCLNDYRTHMGEDFTYVYPQRVHGITDIHSNPKPSYFELKSILCPIEIVSIKKKDGTASVTLRCKNGIPAYTVRDYEISTSRKKVFSGELNPGEKRLFELKYNQKSDTLRIIRPTGFEVLAVPL